MPDVLVSTPSINVRKPLLDYTDEEFDRVVDLNLKGTFRLIREFGRGMAERGSGSIIAFSSFRRRSSSRGRVYAATKSGTVQMLALWPPSWARRACGSTPSPPGRSRHRSPPR